MIMVGKKVGQERLEESLGYVGMDLSVLDRYPHQLSGGQRQRVMIARALMMRPKLLVADEATSMLDASLRVNVLNVLKDLREELGITVLFITHDIGQACYLADRVLVMEHGLMVEQGTTDEVIFNPQHEYTKRLLADVPKLHEEIELHDLQEELQKAASWPELDSGRDAAHRFARRLERSRHWWRSVGTRAGTYQAEVPGCVHTDLMAAGVIPDPYLDGNEAALRWMYGIDWRYATVLDSSTVPLQSPAPGERVDLVFDGIDTIATIRLGNSPDGVELGRTYNMHRSYRFDISQHLTGQPVELEVDLQSATAYAEAEQERLGDRPSAFPRLQLHSQDGVQLRLGLGPDLRTAGLWKPVRLERWSVRGLLA